MGGAGPAGGRSRENHFRLFPAPNPRLSALPPSSQPAAQPLASLTLTLLPPLMRTFDDPGLPAPGSFPSQELWLPLTPATGGDTSTSPTVRSRCLWGFLFS